MLNTQPGVMIFGLPFGHRKVTNRNNMTKGKSPTNAAQISLFASKEAPASFRKAVQVLHSLPKAPLTLLQRKVANAWLKNALDNEPHPDGFWQMSVQELSLSTGFD